MEIYSFPMQPTPPPFWQKIRGHPSMCGGEDDLQQETTQVCTACKSLCPPSSGTLTLHPPGVRSLQNGTALQNGTWYKTVHYRIVNVTEQYSVTKRYKCWAICPLDPQPPKGCRDETGEVE